MSLKVLKFGGSSVGSAEALRRAAAIVGDELPSGGLVVVSALRGTTDSILEACATAGRGDLQEAQDVLATLRSRHLGIATELGYLQAVQADWDHLFARLDQFLTGMAMLGEATPRARDGALAIGETLSAHLAARCFGGIFHEVRDVMRTDARFGKARPLLGAIREAAADTLLASLDDTQKIKAHYVLPGLVQRGDARMMHHGMGGMMGGFR